MASYIDMAQREGYDLNGIKRPSVKPPLPARPPHLKPTINLPKPPENYLSDIKTLINSLESKDELAELEYVLNDSFRSSSQSLSSQSTTSFESETYGYMQPVSIPCTQTTSTNFEMSLPEQVPPSPPRLKREDTSRLSDIFRKVINIGSSNNSSSDEKGTDSGDGESSKGTAKSTQQQRPLPLPPDPDITTMPWFKNVDRRKGEELLRNGVDGYFLVRPSSKAQNSLTLTLWFHNRVYNIPIRRRSDRQFALGTPKPNEQCFSSIEAMITNYRSEKLVLYSGGVKTGKTLLTSCPL